MFKWFKNKSKRQVPEVDRYFELAKRQLTWLHRANESQRALILGEMSFDELCDIVDVCSIHDGLRNTLLARYEERKPPLDEPFPEGE
jgi:hypothetical protein